MNKKRWLSVLLCFALVLSLMPTTAFAVGNEPAAEATCTQSTDCQAELHTEGCPAALPVAASEPPESPPETTETTDALTGPEETFTEPTETTTELAEPTQPPEQPTEPTGEFTEPTEAPTEATEEPTGADELTPAQRVQAMIDALPDADSITAETAEEVKAQLAVIDEAKAELTDEELDCLEFTRYEAAVTALKELEANKGLCPHHPAHTEACGYIAPNDGEPCQHEHTEACGEACPHTHDEECGYVEPNPGAPCCNVCKLCPVQAMIDALLEAESITEENAEAVKRQLTAIDDAKVNLTDEELDALDITRYEAAVSVLMELEGMAGANEPELLIDNVSYLSCDENGENWTTKTASCTEVTADMTTWGTEGTESWYVVNSTVTINDRITVNGNVHLILADGKTLTASQGIDVYQAHSLSIYAQSTGTDMGKLVAGHSSSQWGEPAGIGGPNDVPTGPVTINGGYVKASGGQCAAGIGGAYNGKGGPVTINGGTVEAVGHSTAIGHGLYNSVDDPGIINLGTPSSPKLWYVKGIGWYDPNGAGAGNISGSPFASAQTSLSFKGFKYVKIYQGMVPVPYLDASGANQECIDYTVLTNQTTLNDGWYVVNSNVTTSSRITVSGDVHLILVDGTTLNSGGININSGNSLTIYAQSTGSSMGKLVATTNTGQEAGITCNGTLTINGGDITATGRQYGAGIGGKNAWQQSGRDPRGSCGTVIINGGIVKAFGTENAAGIGGGQCGNGGTVIINGGTVEATAGPKGSHAIGAGGGDSGASNGSLKIGTPGSGNYWYVKGGADSSNQQNVSGSPFAAAQENIVTNVSGKKYVRIYQNVAPLPYIEADGTTGGCDEYTVLTNQTNLTSGWYVVRDTQSISDRITVNGDVHLILVDGTTLDSCGINVDSGNSLTVYAQSTGSSMGKLTATVYGGQEAGITCGGTLTINGGDVTATSHQLAAGIGGKNAWLPDGARDPRGSCGTVIINGGIVKAFGANRAAGIGGGHYGNGGTVIINGGTVQATAGGDGCNNAIGAGISASSNGSLKIGTPGSGNYWYVKGGANSSDAANVNGSPFAAAQENIVTNVSGKMYVRIYQNGAALPYIEADGTTGGCDEYTVLTNQTTLTSGWYVVNSNVSISDRITVDGDVKLILVDGCTLNAQQGIGVVAPNSLSIYWQSGKTGALNANNPSGGGAAIGGNKNGSSGTTAGTIVINGGNITANVTDSGGACIGQSGWSGAGGTVTVNNGYLKLYSAAGNEGAFGSGTTRTVSGGIIEYTSTTTYDTITGSTMDNCIVFNNSDTGTVYGDPTVDFDYTMDSGKTITVPSGQTLTVAAGATLTNSGSIYVDGTLTGSVAGSVYYPLTVTGGSAEQANTSTQNGKTYGLSGKTITLTAEDKVGQTVSWNSNEVTVADDNTFTMPSKAVTVSTEYINAPTYTVTIPASVEVNSTATVSASGVNVASGSTLVVKIDDSTSFIMENAENATLNYAVHKEDTSGPQLDKGSNILEIPGGEKDASASAVLAFTLAPDEIEKYSGVYKGRIIFHVSLTNATP